MGDQIKPSRRRPTGRRLLAVLAVANLAVLGADAFLLSQRNVTRPVSFASALQRFRATAAGTAAAPALEPAPSSTGGAPASLAGAKSTSGGGGQAPAPASARWGATVTAAPSGGPVVPPHVGGAFNLPAPGVYAYRTTGGEQIDILNSSHSYPSTTYGTVRLQAGCNWQLENDVVQEHTDRRNFCSSPGQLFQLDQAREITFFGRTDGADYACTPRMLLARVGEVAGTARDSVCADSSGNAARIHGTDLGTTRVTVGGVTVTAFHVVLDSTLSGRATGKAHDDLLLAADTGMTLSWHRSVDSVADAAFGAKAHYTEHATFDLISLTPST